MNQFLENSTNKSGSSRKVQFDKKVKQQIIHKTLKKRTRPPYLMFHILLNNKHSWLPAKELPGIIL
uniref:Uncharacterized protein n=1 Tax=Rhizophora mucronata TaxID=61149 RepID=A0A2P2Q4X6_RHIMU